MAARLSSRSDYWTVLALVVFCGLLIWLAVGARTILSPQAISLPSAHALGTEIPVVTSEALRTGLSLHGQWRFQPGDDLTWASPTLDDSGWGTMAIPARWPKGGYPETGQLAWYRMTLQMHDSVLREAQLSQLAIHVGKVMSAYEFYAGGQLVGKVGSLPPLAVSEYDRERIFAVPMSAVAEDGRLVLALRVWGGPPHSVKAWSAGAFSGEFELGEYRKLMVSGFVAEVPGLIFSALFLAFGFYHLYLYCRNTVLDAYLWYGLMAITISIYGLMLTQYKYLFDWPFESMKKAEFGAIYLLPALVIQMTWPLLKMPIGKALRAYQLSFVALFLVVVVTPGQRAQFLTLVYWQVWSLPLLLYTPWLLVRSALGGNKEARPLAVGAVVFVSTCINDLLIDFTYLQTNRLAPLGFVAVLVAMAISLADRFTAMFNSLEVEVAQRTVQLSEANERLAQAARVDHLTGLLNRRGFSEEAALEMRRELRTGRGFSVVLADVDHFKKFNDLNGHICGDHVLQQVAAMLAQRVRAIDCVARWGGEEFILLLPETGIEGAAIIAEKLREAIADMAFDFEGQGLHLTMTFGVADHRKGESIDTCIDRADAALYEGKALGRNKVMVGSYKGLTLVS